MQFLLFLVGTHARERERFIKKAASILLVMRSGRGTGVTFFSLFFKTKTRWCGTPLGNHHVSTIDDSQAQQRR
jgi:hypothetical protein